MAKTLKLLRLFLNLTVLIEVQWTKIDSKCTIIIMQTQACKQNGARPKDKETVAVHESYFES